MSLTSIVRTVATKARIHSPKILLLVGIGTIIGGTVAACVATTKLDEVVDKAKEDLDVIEDKYETGEVTEEEAPKLKTTVYLRAAVSTAKLYLPATLMIAGGITSILVSHRILARRNLALTAACETTAAAFNRYRRNVVNKYGKDVDYELASTNNPRPENAEDLDKLVKEEKECPWNSSWDRCFDEGNPNWQRYPDHNQNFLYLTENRLNDIMNSRRKETVLKNGVIKVIPGHITAREVYVELGWEKPEDFRKEDLIIGKMTDGACDPNAPDWLDFGIFTSDDDGAIRFVNGTERSVWLHPNFDGAIDNKIGVPIYFLPGKKIRCDKHGRPL